MSYRNNQNCFDANLMKKLGKKDPSRTIPRVPFLQYKFNERQMKNINHLQATANFNRNLEGKMEYMRQDIATLTRQGRRPHIDKENENFIEQYNENIHATKMGTFTLNRTQKNAGELECLKFFWQNNNNFKPSTHYSTHCGGVCIDRIRNKLEPDFIYLKDVIKAKASGLTESEGWSLLCQSVQALQDLFISNATLSSSPILPVIHPDTMRISSRGRVAFDILSSHLVRLYLCFLSPEYLSNLDKTCEFLESDIEKIWIYSLGITLQHVIRTHPAKQQIWTDSTTKNVKSADIEHGGPLSLEKTIRSMCVANIRCRASLMYLLDIISQYCRIENIHKKPFSHVTRDLFREVIGKLDNEKNSLCASKHSDQISLTADCLRVKKYSKAQSKVRNQNMRLEYLLNKQLYNRNEMPHEPLSLNTMHKLASLPDATLPGIAPLNVRKVPKNHRKRFEEDDSRNIQPGFIPDSGQFNEINLLQGQSCLRQINILCLNGSNYKIRCDATAKISQILENILINEQLEENFFLGLCALIGGDFVFLPSKMKVLKIYERMNSTEALVPKTFKKCEITTITLYLRVKFYLSNIKDMSTTSHHLIYLQLRKSILEQQILCTMQDMIVLGGLALQAEFGDYQPLMESKEYFATSYYLPDSGLYLQKNKEFSNYLRNAHFCRRGLPRQDAEYQFIQYVQSMEEYGMHLYSAVLDSKVKQNVYIGISMKGMSILNRPTPKINVDTYKTENYNPTSSNLRKSYLNLNWIDIENLSYSKHIFSIIVKQQTNEEVIKKGNRNKYRFKMWGKKSFFAFSLASEHHQLHIKLKGSAMNIDKYNFIDLNIPLKVNTNLHNNRINDGKFLRKLWHRSTSSNDFMAYEKESSIRTTTQNFRNEFCVQSEYDEYNNVNSPFKLLSPNRNRVKMGTRVYSSMNRSYNEINNLDGCNRRCIPTKNRYLKTQTISMKPRDFQRNQKFSRCVSEKKYNTDDKLSSQQSSSSKFFNLDKDGVTCHSKGAYVIDSCFGSATDVSLFSLQNESVSATLLDKFINMASTSNNFNDRIITRIAIVKDSSFDQNMRNERKQPAISIAREKKLYSDRCQEQILGAEEIKPRMSLGISIVQGLDKNIYVKDLVKDSPAERHGITIGDQLLAVNGVSVLNSSYQEVVDLLRSTGVIVELTVSQLYQNFENKLKLESMRYINVEDSDSIQCARTSLHELTNIKQERLSFVNISTKKFQFRRRKYGIFNRMVRKVFPDVCANNDNRENEQNSLSRQTIDSINISMISSKPTQKIDSHKYRDGSVHDSNKKTVDMKHEHLKPYDTPFKKVTAIQDVSPKRNSGNKSHSKQHSVQYNEFRHMKRESYIHEYGKNVVVLRQRRKKKTAPVPPRRN